MLSAFARCRYMIAVTSNFWPTNIRGRAFPMLYGQIDAYATRVVFDTMDIYCWC